MTKNGGGAVRNRVNNLVFNCIWNDKILAEYNQLVSVISQIRIKIFFCPGLQQTAEGGEGGQGKTEGNHIFCYNIKGTLGLQPYLK